MKMFRVGIALGAMALLAAASQQTPQSPAEIAPVAPTILKTYERGPDGLELFSIRGVVIEPSTGALWIKYGKGPDPAIRIDRRTGSIKTIGRAGSGPNEYRNIWAMVPGVQADVGIWDSLRRSWFWVDSAGVQRRTWSVPTNGLTQRVFSDLRGNAYIGQNPKPGDFSSEIAVRVDSARGLVDSTPVPIASSSKWSWTYTSVSGGGRSTYGTAVYCAPAVMWGVDALGRMFAISSDSNVIVVRDGSRERRLFLPNYREALTAAERAQADSGLDQFVTSARSRNGQLDGPRPPIPASRPQVDDVLPEMNGGIVVVRSRQCSAIPSWHAPGGGGPGNATRCGIAERFDSAGRRLRPFTLTYGHQLMALRGDTAWVVAPTADGLARVIEMVIPRPQ